MLRSVVAQNVRTPAFIVGSSCNGLKSSDISRKGVEKYSDAASHNRPVVVGFSNLDVRRSIHQSCSLCRFWESNPRGEYKDKNLHEEIERIQKENLWGIKTGFKDLREEVGKWAAEWKEKLDDTNLYVVQGDKEKIWTFNSKDSLRNWNTLADSDHNEGFSRCELTFSPTGKALFHGFVNTTPPKDGRIKNAGFCVMKSKRPMKSFQRKTYHDWSDYTHLIMKVRGDGRHYLINLSTAGYYDITWNDVYHYVLYTRGGPYWQYVRIPFSKFAFGSKGRIQDMQDPVPLDRIANLQLLAGKVDGPFCLEVDFIGVERDKNNPERFAYETYRIPKYIANV